MKYSVKIKNVHILKIEHQLCSRIKNQWLHGRNRFLANAVFGDFFSKQ